MLNSTTTLLALLAGAITMTEAVNINAYTVNSCAGGPYEVCNNIGPNICCNIITSGSNPHGATSGEFVGLPGGSTFSGYQTSRSGLVCGSSTGGHSGSGNVCITLNAQVGQYAGFAWFSGSNKVRRVAEGECKGKQDADEIVFGNGTSRSIKGLSTTKKVALWDAAVKDWEAEKNVHHD